MPEHKKITTRDGTQITVFSKIEAAAYHDEFDAVLTIEDPDGGEDSPFRINPEKNIPQMVLQFHDTLSIMYPSEKPFVREHAKQALEFIESHKGKRIAIHCHAGISRSTALSLAIITKLNGSENAIETVDLFYKTFLHIDPNSRVIEISDMVYNLDHELASAFHEKRSALLDEERKENQKKLSSKKSRKGLKAYQDKKSKFIW